MLRPPRPSSSSSRHVLHQRRSHCYCSIPVFPASSVSMLGSLTAQNPSKEGPQTNILSHSHRGKHLASPGPHPKQPSRRSATWRFGWTICRAETWHHQRLDHLKIMDQYLRTYSVIYYTLIGVIVKLRKVDKL